MNGHGNAQHWSPWSLLASQENYAQNYAIVILNRPINFPTKRRYLLNLWENAALRVTVDGGTDRWLDWLKGENLNVQDVKPPELVTGDMDSISKSSLNFCKSMTTTKVILTENQDMTDFTKALLEINKYASNNNINLSDILIISEISGRLDQLLSNLHTLHNSVRYISNGRLFMLCPDSLTWVLSAGKHDVEIPRNLRESKEWCALMPLAGPCTVTTTGLKWNLDKSVLQMGGLFSTSNTYNGDEHVQISTDNPLVWSMGIDPTDWVI